MAKTQKSGFLSNVKKPFNYITALSLDKKGFKCVQKQQYQKAISIFRRAGKLFQEIGNRGGVSKQLGNLAMTYRVLGTTQNNVEYLNKGINIW